MPDLYRKGNETVRLLRELARMGDVAISCDAGSLPLLDKLDPDGAYLTWRVELSTNEDIAAIHELFEFVVDDCELEIMPSGSLAVSEEPQSAQLPPIEDVRPAPAPLAAVPAESRPEPTGGGRAHEDDGRPGAPRRRPRKRKRRDRNTAKSKPRRRRSASISIVSIG